MKESFTSIVDIVESLTLVWTWRAIRHRWRGIGCFATLEVARILAGRSHLMRVFRENEIMMMFNVHVATGGQPFVKWTIRHFAKWRYTHWRSRRSSLRILLHPQLYSVCSLMTQWSNAVTVYGTWYRYALSQSIPDFRTWVQHTHKFWCYRIATVTIIYVLHGNKSLILTLTLNPIYCWS